MSEIERLTKLRRQEQEVRDYPKSSRWYTGTGLAIKYLELAETATTSAESFRNSWYAIYNLYMMIHKRGESENIALSDWIAEAQASQKVREIALTTPTPLFEALIRAQNSLLFDAESKKPRDAKQFVDQWLFKRKQGKELSAERASAYLLLIGRDLRNAISHPKQDPNAPAIKKALKLAAETFLPLAIAATEAIIERPPEGTTGRVVAYRSFLYPFLKNSDSPFSDYYLERLFPEQELSAFPEDESKAALKEINKELTTRRKDLVRADAEETLRSWCEPVLFQKLGLAAERGAKIVTDDGVFEPTAVIKKSANTLLRREYKGKDAGRDLACLIWVLPWSTSLDAVSDDEESSGKTVMEVAQSALTRSDVDWAMLTNGQKLRLLSKTTAHKPRSFMEIDLAAIAERWIEREAQLAFRYLLGLCSQNSLIEQDVQDRTRLERALRESERHGKEISDELKKNVFSALEELGEGFLAYMRSKPAELDAWRKRRAPSLTREEFLKSDELLTDIYHESLSLMYRLLFLFYAEGRDLLPMEDETYRDSYSLESIRDDIIATHDDPDPKSFFSPGSFALWGRLKELFEAVDGGWKNIIPAYNGGLFDTEQHPFLETFAINDQQLARAIDLLSRTSPGAVRGEGRKKVTYRDLDIRHLGSIYEGILEYHAEIADQEKVVIKRGTAGKIIQEYSNASELTADEKKHLKTYREAVKEDEDNPAPPKSCKVTGLKEAGEYYLISGGRESKRKSSGSYYTPDYIVQYIVENTLGPLVRGETRPSGAVAQSSGRAEPEEQSAAPQPLSSDEILDLKVLDPAMGSGHFLVAATEYLARAYGGACIREGKGRDGVMSDEVFVHYKRIIAERCIYGVDKNLMAVELAKLSLWLFTMDKGRPLSFLNHNLKCGNSLIGAWIKALGSPPEYDENGKRKKRARRDARTGNLFEIRFQEKVPLMVRDLIQITQKETDSIADVKAKKVLDDAVTNMKRPFKNIADIWVGLHFGEKAENYNSLLVDIEQAREQTSENEESLKPFHWELEFPVAFFDKHGNRLTQAGFNAIVGNPPWGGHYKSLTTAWLMSTFSQFHQRTPETANYFVGAICQGFLRTSGMAGLILPSALFYQNEFGRSRRILLDKFSVKNFVNLGENVFENVTAPCGIVTFGNEPPASSYLAADLRDVPREVLQQRLRALVVASSQSIPISDVLSLKDSPFVSDPEGLAFARMTQGNGTPISNFAEDIASGIASSGDDAFRLSSRDALRAFGTNAILHPVIKGEDITEFHVTDDSGHVIIYSTKETDASRYPEVLAHLSTFKKKLSQKRETVQGKLPWYCLHWPRYPELFDSPKVVLRQTADTLIAAVDTKGYYALNSIIIVKIKRNKDSLTQCRYLAGILNSEPIKKLYNFLTQEEDRVFAEVKPSNVRKLSLPNLSESDQSIVIRTVERLEEIQKERIQILRKRDGETRSIHQMLLSLRSDGVDKLGELTSEYQRLKFRIDEIVQRGLEESAAG